MLNFFQEDTLVNPIQEVEPLVEEKTLSLMDLLFSGGTAGTVIIIVLFVLLFVAVYIYFERLFAIKAASNTDSNFMHQIKDSVLAGNIESARIRCAQANSPVARLTAKGLDRIGSPLEDINTAIENAGRLEVYKLEKNVNDASRLVAKAKTGMVCFDYSRKKVIAIPEEAKDKLITGNQ